MTVLQLSHALENAEEKLEYTKNRKVVLQGQPAAALVCQV